MYAVASAPKPSRLADPGALTGSYGPKFATVKDASGGGAGTPPGRSAYRHKAQGGLHKRVHWTTCTTSPITISAKAGAISTNGRTSSHVFPIAECRRSQSAAGVI